MENKTVVITGSGSGLGKALAKFLIKGGAKVMISDIDAESLKSASEELKTVSKIADVTKESDVSNLSREAVKLFGRIDYWINNAGIWMPHVEVENLDIQKLRMMIEVNLIGTVLGSKAALAEMNRQGSGVIVNVISVRGLEGKAGSSGYAASKFATRGFTDSLRKEVNPRGIKVFSVYPGGMKTHLFDKKLPDDFDSYMDVEDVAETIIENLKKDNPEVELTIKGPADK